NNVTSQSDYDFGVSPPSSPLRTTLRKFSGDGCTGCSDQYASAHIFGLPISEDVVDGSGNNLKHSTWAYDESALTSRSGTIPGWTSPGAALRANLTTRCSGDASVTSCEHYVYDVLGNRVTVQDPTGHSTTYDFTDNFTDVSKNGSKYAFPKTVT